MRTRCSTLFFDCAALLVGVLLALAIGACGRTGSHPGSQHDGDVVHWGYEANDGPAVWAALDPSWTLCREGVAQSPIDLATPSPIDLPPLTLDLPSRQQVRVRNQRGVVDALDNGHTIQINSHGGSKLIVGDASYELGQFHFHAPSEHTVDGAHYPMEIHFVHQGKDGSLAVIGVLVESGGENPAIEPLWEQLEETPGDDIHLRMPPDFGKNIITGTPTGVYHYEGSLTTPPCTEGVLWYVVRTPTQFSLEQISEFTAVYDHNNRPEQPRAERRLYLDRTPIVTRE